MSPAVRDRNDRAIRRIDMESAMFKRQCSVNVICTDRTKCAIRIDVPRNTLIHNLSVQVRESSSSRSSTSTNDENNSHSVINKWRFVSNREKSYERNLFHLGSEHVHLVGRPDKLSNKNLDQFTPVRSHRSPLMDSTNTPPPPSSSQPRIFRRGGDENMSTPVPRNRRRVPDRSIRLKQSHKSVTFEVRGLSPNTLYEFRVISEALHRGDVTELAVLRVNTFKESDRLVSLMSVLARQEDGILLSMQGRRISSFRDRWPLDIPDMILFDNGPRNYSIKRLTAGFKGLRLREFSEEKEKKRTKSPTTTTTTTTTHLPSFAVTNNLVHNNKNKQQDKENPLSSLRNRIAAMSVGGMMKSTIKPLADTTNTISSSELASSKNSSKNVQKLISLSKTGAVKKKKKKAARRRKLQRKALNRL